MFALLSDTSASHVVSVRQVSILPMTSFRFHLTVDTLVTSANDSPCRARWGEYAMLGVQIKRAGISSGPLIFPMLILSLGELVASPCLHFSIFLSFNHS
jgi:hypothetical protein